MRRSRPAGGGVAALVLLACLSCGAPASDESAATGEAGGRSPAIDLARLELVDLTHPFDESTIYWPTSPQGFELETLSEGVTEAGFYYSAKMFSTPEHGGTHLDAPVHFAEHGWSVEEIPLQRLVVPAVVIDVAEQTAADPDYRLDAAAVLDWEAQHGRIEEGVAVLLETGWSERWPDADAYFGRDSRESTALHFPSFGPSAARLLVEERGVALLGVDTASIDYGPSSEFEVHQIASGANVSGLENLTRLAELPPRGSWIAALPMKITNGSGAPVRVVALVPRSPE